MKQPVQKQIEEARNRVQEKAPYYNARAVEDELKSLARLAKSITEEEKAKWALETEKEASETKIGWAEVVARFKKLQGKVGSYKFTLPFDDKQRQEVLLRVGTLVGDLKVGIKEGIEKQLFQLAQYFEAGAYSVQFKVDREEDIKDTRQHGVEGHAHGECAAYKKNPPKVKQRYPSLLANLLTMGKKDKDGRVQLFFGKRQRGDLTSVYIPKGDRGQFQHAFTLYQTCRKLEDLVGKIWDNVFQEKEIDYQETVKQIEEKNAFLSENLYSDSSSFGLMTGIFGQMMEKGTFENLVHPDSEKAKERWSSKARRIIERRVKSIAQLPRREREPHIANAKKDILSALLQNNWMEGLNFAEASKAGFIDKKKALTLIEELKEHYSNPERNVDKKAVEETLDSLNSYYKLLRAGCALETEAIVAKAIGKDVIQSGTRTIDEIINVYSEGVPTGAYFPNPHLASAQNQDNEPSIHSTKAGV